MIDTLHALGLTDWSSFFWGAVVMFVLVCVTIGLWTWGSANAPTAKDCEEEHWRMTWDAKIIGKSAVTVAIEHAGRFLCNLRDDKAWIWAPNHWAFLGGQVEEGEWIANAAIREIAEETGVLINRAGLIPVAEILETKNQIEKVSTLLLYRASAGEFDQMVCNEGVSLKWLSSNDFTGEPKEHEGHLIVTAHFEVIKRLE